MTLFLSAHGTSLVWVRLFVLSKGKPELHAMVCVPTAEDLKSLDRKPAASGPQEPPHRDHFKRRKGPKAAAASSLCSDKTDSKESDPHPASEPNPTPSEGLKPSLDLPSGLWPDPLPSVTAHCSRVTLGWVTQGDFSLSTGCGEALGLVSVAGLLSTLFNQPAHRRGTLLLRNPTSLHYHFAKVDLEV